MPGWTEARVVPSYTLLSTLDPVTVSDFGRTFTALVAPARVYETDGVVDAAAVSPV